MTASAILGVTIAGLKIEMFSLVSQFLLNVQIFIFIL